MQTIREDIKDVIANVSQLKYEIQTNKELTFLTGEGNFDWIVLFFVRHLAFDDLISVAIFRCEWILNFENACFYFWIVRKRQRYMEYVYPAIGWEWNLFFDQMALCWMLYVPETEINFRRYVSHSKPHTYVYFRSRFGVWFLVKKRIISIDNRNLILIKIEKP